MLPGLFFTYAVVALSTTVNVLRPPSNPQSRFPALWLPGMLVGELIPHVVVTRLVIGGALLAMGARRGIVGELALWLLVASLAGMVVVAFQARTAIGRIVEAVDSAFMPAPSAAIRLRLPSRLPEGVELVRGIRYHADLTLDIYRPAGNTGPGPTLLYIHGGSWTGGDPHRQALPTFHHLAARGWKVVTIRYPLSPAATFPDHLIGVKRAIAWAKHEGRQLGIDPQRLALSGGSAGGHLAALAALTAGDASFQPGFEDVDTTVRACVPMYGVYDFANRNGTRHDWPVIPRAVMKATLEQDPGRYSEASPLDQVGPEAPPFYIVHGAYDSLVPPHEARQFVLALRAHSRCHVEYLEVGGAQHAFDAVNSPRTRAVTGAVTQFLERSVAL